MTVVYTPILEGLTPSRQSDFHLLPLLSSSCIPSLIESINLSDIFKIMSMATTIFRYGFSFLTHIVCATSLLFYARVVGPTV